MYYEKLVIYLIFKNGKVAIANLHSGDRIRDVQMMDVKGLEVKNLSVGYFVKVGNDLLFVNSNVVIKVTTTNAEVVNGYQSYGNFESVVGLEKGYFAVVNLTTGIYIYSYNGTAVRRTNTFERNILMPPGGASELQLMDAVYFKNKSVLITVDFASGVHSFEVSYLDDGIALHPSNLILTAPKCKLAYVFNTSLYVSCLRMYTFDLSDYPTLSEQFLPPPNIEVREIYETDEFVVFIGRNVFTLLYLDRPASYFEDSNLDKIVFSGRMYISANEGGLEIGEINIVPPYVSCYTSSRSFLGTTALMFKTVAECNDTYFTKYKVDKELLGTIEPNDVCIYTVYSSINYWEVGEINTYPFIGAAIGFVCIVLFLVGMFLVKGMKIQKMQTLL
jgi:hypothetical protein